MMVSGLKSCTWFALQLQSDSPSCLHQHDDTTILAGWRHLSSLYMSRISEPISFHEAQPEDRPTDCKHSCSSPAPLRVLYSWVSASTVHRYAFISSVRWSPATMIKTITPLYPTVRSICYTIFAIRRRHSPAVTYNRVRCLLRCRPIVALAIYIST